MLGQLWCLIGCFRLHLLIPFHCIDPTAKYSIKFLCINQILENMKNEILIERQLEKLFTGNDSNFIIEKLLKQLKRLEIEANSLKEKVFSIFYYNFYFFLKISFRPSPSQFEFLFQNIHQFYLTTIDKEKILEIINFILNEVDLNYLQESMFQDKSCQFIKILEDKFPQYMDIWQPLAVSIYQIKYGLRLLISFHSIQKKKERKFFEVNFFFNVLYINIYRKL